MYSRTTNHLSPAGEGGDKEEARIFFFRGDHRGISRHQQRLIGGDYVKLTANKGGIVRILCRRIR